MLLGLWFVQGNFFSQLDLEPMRCCTRALPAAMWIVAGVYVRRAVLAYLDLRTRREGWAVELHAYGAKRRD